MVSSKKKILFLWEIIIMQLKHYKALFQGSEVFCNAQVLPRRIIFIQI